MNQSNLLSIFIPTYNRANLLAETLESIVSQISNNFIEIVISDNGSTDNTKEIVDLYRQKYKNIRYYKNEPSIHMDLNHLKVLEYVDTKYCLMLGDDDVLVAEGYERIIESIENDNYDFIVLSSENDSNIKFDNVELSNKKAAFLQYWKDLPYGTVIINVMLAKKIDVQKYVDTYHAYSALAWESFACSESNNKILVIKKPTIRLGIVIKTWKKETIDILYRAAPLWFNLLPEIYSPEIILKKHYITYYKISVLMKLKSEGLFDYKTVSLLKPQKMSNIKLNIVKLIPVNQWNRFSSFYHLLKK